MGIRVPVNPSTSPASGVIPLTPEGRQHRQDGFAEGLASLGQSLQRVQDRRVAEQKQVDQFELSHKLLVEKNERDADMSQRMLDADVGGGNIVERVGTDYAAKNQQLISEAEAAGYDKDTIRGFSLGLDRLTGGYLGQALEFQERGRATHALTLIDANVTELGKQAVTHPELAEELKVQLEHNIDMVPGLSAAQREEEKAKQWGRIRPLAGAAFARDNPEATLQYLAPHLLPKAGVAATSPTGPFSLDEYIEKMAPVEGTGKNPRSSAVGFGQFLDNTWAGKPGGTGVYQKVFGNTGETRDQILAKKKDPAVARRVAEQFTRDNVAGLEAAGVPVSNTSVYMAHFLGLGDAIKVAKADLTASIRDVVSPASVKSNPEVFKSGMTVEGFLRWAGGKMGAAMDENGLVQAEAAPVEEVKPEGERVPIPALDLLSGPEQLQVINQARDAMRQVDAQGKAAAAQQVENALTALQAGMPAGDVPSKEVLQGLFGEVQGAAMAGKIEAATAAQPFISGLKTASNQAIQTQVAALLPTDPNDPDFTSKMAVYNEAAQAAAQNLALREKDPTEYMMGAFPNVTQMAATAQTLEEKQAAYKAMANAFKQLGVPESEWAPVTKEQAEKVGASYLNANPETRLNMLTDWFSALGPGPMTRGFVSRMVEANSKVGPSLGRDAFLYATLSGHPEFSAVMRDAMAGAEASVDSSRRISTEQADKSWRLTFGPAAVALNGAAAENYKQVAMDLYVNAGGPVPQGPGAVLDSTLWNESVRRALGGLRNNKETGFAKLDGASRPTILPPSVTKTEFQGFIDTLTPGKMSQASGGTGAYTKFGKPALIRDIQDHGTFVMKAPGAYAIQFPDGGTLLNNKGGEYIIRISPQLVRGR